MKFIRNTLKALGTMLFNAVPVVCCSMYYCLFMYFTNAGEAAFTDIVKPLLLSLALGTGSYVLFTLFTRSWAKSVLGACAVVLAFINYRHIENMVTSILPSVRYWQLLPVLAFVVLWVFVIYARKANKELVSTINLVLSLMFGVLIVINGVTAAPTIIEKINLKAAANVSAVENSADDASRETHPNIYHFMLDEFSSTEVMQTYYEYDTSWFVNSLENKGFAVGRNNRNETIDSDTLWCNLVNLDYVVNNGTARTVRVANKKNSALEQLLRSHGYEMIGLAHSGQHFGIGGGTSAAQAKTIDGQNLEFMIMKNTAMYPFVVLDTSTERAAVLNTFEWYQNPENLQGTNRYVQAYLLMAHEPFLFDENGGFVDETNYSNWRDKQYYRGYYSFTCKMLEQAVESIIRHDPNAIILIQSDHSARAADDYELYLKWIGLHDARRTFQAVYFGGQEFENIDVRSGVNIMRSVLTRLFDTDAYPQLEEPDYYNWQGGVFE